MGATGESVMASMLWRLSKKTMDEGSIASLFAGGEEVEGALISFFEAAAGRGDLFVMSECNLRWVLRAVLRVALRVTRRPFACSAIAEEMGVREELLVWCLLGAFGVLLL